MKSKKYKHGKTFLSALIVGLFLFNASLFAQSLENDAETVKLEQIDGEFVEKK